MRSIYPNVFYLFIVENKEECYERVCPEKSIDILVKRKGFEGDEIAIRQYHNEFEERIPRSINKDWTLEVEELPFNRPYLFAGKHIKSIMFKPGMDPIIEEGCFYKTILPGVIDL